jgi:UDP-N-acetyl-D-mannosaminuronic acid dehydrogenase
MYNITIVGGCGHIGIPLALILAENGHCVTALDIDFKIVSDVNSGILHFQEEGLQPLLNKHLGSNKFVATTKK